MQNITNGKAFSIPWIIHEYTEQGTNSDFLLVSKPRLTTTPTFALEKQTRLVRKQTRFILTLPVAGAVIGQLLFCVYAPLACSNAGAFMEMMMIKETNLLVYHFIDV